MLYVLNRVLRSAIKLLETVKVDVSSTMKQFEKHLIKHITLEFIHFAMILTEPVSVKLCVLQLIYQHCSGIEIPQWFRLVLETYLYSMRTKKLKWCHVKLYKITI